MRRQIELTQGRSLIAGQSFAKGKSRDWVVFLPESGSQFQSGSRREVERLLGRRLASRFNYLVINKPGLGPKGTDWREFERSFRRHYRLQDARTALARLLPKDANIYLVGYSEGAYLAPEVARLESRVRAVIMIGGGTRGWLKEEISNAPAAKRAGVIKQVRHIQRHARSPEKWNGFSFATWNSYRADSTLRALRRLRTPVLSILGARDRVIDYKSALADLKSLSRRRPVHTHVFENCGHGFNGRWTQVQRVLRQFLERAPDQL